MSVASYVLGLLRCAAVAVPALLIAWRANQRVVRARGSFGALVVAVLALSTILVTAELLGILALMSIGALVAALFALTLAVLSLTRSPRPAAATATAPARERARASRLSTACAVTCVVIVAAQWSLGSANSLGSGMSNFDTLWYHMPFAATMAQSGSVTAVKFTQADPYVAYYPANSELLHAVGIQAMGSDLLSPLVNLGWLALLLLSAWCLGRPWALERQTLTAAALIASLPVLSTTQPGEAFNDIVGISAVLAGAAIAVNARSSWPALATAGLALGIAAGTKYTFLVPAAVLVAGFAAAAPSGRRSRALLALAAPAALTAGWWYLRNLLATGNPLGIAMRLGPLHLAGPVSQLESSQQQSVISQIGDTSLWGSRFVPGLEHALGPLWPLVLACCAAAVLLALSTAGQPGLRVIAAGAALTAVSYLFLPTGASAIAHEGALFEVNLRYAAPALMLAAVLVPLIVASRAPRLLAMTAPALTALLIISQLEHKLWPTQPARHLALLAAATVVAIVLARARVVPAWPRSRRAAAAACVLGALAAAGFAVQLHYFNGRYLRGSTSEPALARIYSWAQSVAHARVALYGTVLQYPLYGARDTNVVDYLARRTPGGGFRPISTCAGWRRALNDGHYDYLVLTPGPTAPVPAQWTATSPSAHLLLDPASGLYVYRLTGPLDPAACGTSS